MLFLTCVNSMLFAQQDEKTRKKIEATRIALITERLDLSPEQAEKFWPVYKQYIKQKRNIQAQFKERLGNFDPKNASDADTKKALNLRLEKKQEELNLEKDFSSRLLTVISSKQLVSLRQAEQDFRRILLEQINRRKNNNVNQRRIQEERLRQRRGN